MSPNVMIITFPSKDSYVLIIVFLLLKINKS
nr:MAG TPA: hypothetical protein [Caudoviricetes sp.]DAL07126.1 MAG TPA: hypothetical protein [Caudoviricetes sp.]